MSTIKEREAYRAFTVKKTYIAFTEKKLMVGYNLTVTPVLKTCLNITNKYLNYN